MNEHTHLITATVRVHPPAAFQSSLFRPLTAFLSRSVSPVARSTWVDHGGTLATFDALDAEQGSGIDLVLARAGGEDDLAHRLQALGVRLTDESWLWDSLERGEVLDARPYGFVELRARWARENEEEQADSLPDPFLTHKTPARLTSESLTGLKPPADEPSPPCPPPLPPPQRSLAAPHSPSPAPRSHPSYEAPSVPEGDGLTTEPDLDTDDDEAAVAALLLARPPPPKPATTTSSSSSSAAVTASANSKSPSPRRTTAAQPLPQPAQAVATSSLSLDPALASLVPHLNPPRSSDPVSTVISAPSLLNALRTGAGSIELDGLTLTGSAARGELQLREGFCEVKHGTAGFVVRRKM